MIRNSSLPNQHTAPDDVMHVERGATPDGRLLLYFTFTPPDDATRAYAEGGRAAAGCRPSGAGGLAGSQ